MEPAGSGIPFEAWRSWHRYGSLPVRLRSFGIPVPTIAAGWATEAHGPLECYRDFRQKYARATSQPFRRAAGVFATSTRATGARVKLCQAQAVWRFPAESYSLPIPSFPLQPLRPHNARTRARARDRRWNPAYRGFQHLDEVLILLEAFAAGTDPPLQHDELII